MKKKLDFIHYIGYIYPKYYYLLWFLREKRPDDLFQNQRVRDQGADLFC